MQHKKKPTRREKAQEKQPFVESKNIQRKVSHSKSKLKWILAGFIALAGFALYANTLHHDYTLDDYSVIKENRLTRQGWGAFPEVFKTPYRFGYYFTQDELYRPIPKAMFAAEYALAPDNAHLGHWINVLLYALCGLLLFLVLNKYINRTLVIPFAASVLFIAHPVHTEVVASIKSRDEILSLFFILLSLNFIYNYVTKEKMATLIAAMCFYFLSLLSKESGITFIAVFPLMIYFFSSVSINKNVRATLCMLIPVIIFLIIRFSILGSSLKTTFAVADNLLMAAPDSVSRFATAVYILGIYLKLLIFPHPLVFDYSFNQIPIVNVGDWRFLISFIVYLTLFVYAIIRFRKKDFLSFSILWFLIALSIFSNVFLIIGTSFGERLLFLPSLGFCLAIAFLLSKFLSPIKEKRENSLKEFLLNNVKMVSVLCVVFVFYSFKTISRNEVWKNNYTLFSSDVKLSPNSTRTHYYLGNLLAKPDALGRTDSVAVQLTLDTAIVELKKAVEIYPSFADAYNQLGVAYYRKKNMEEAFRYYSKAIENNVTNSTFHSNLGTLYFEKQDFSNALKAFGKAVELDPNYTEGLANLGSTYGALGDYDNALKYLHQCVRTSPDYAQAYFFLSITYQYKGDKQNADFYMNKFKSLGGK